MSSQAETLNILLSLPTDKPFKPPWRPVAPVSMRTVSNRGNADGPRVARSLAGRQRMTFRTEPSVPGIADSWISIRTKQSTLTVASGRHEVVGKVWSR